MWAIAFGVPAEDTLAVTKSIADFLEQIERAKEEIRSIPDIDHQLYLDSFVAIEAIVRIDQLAQSPAQQIQKLKEKSTLQGLRFCAERLSKVYTETEPDAEALSELISSIDELIARLRSKDCEISLDLRRLVIHHLDQIRRKLITYEIGGAEGVAEVVDAAYGSILRNKDQFRVDYEDSQEEVDGFMGVLHKSEAIIANAERVRSLVERSLAFGAWCARFLPT